MKRKTYYRILILVAIMALVWPFSYAIVGDFYPHLKTLIEVLKVKSIANGCLLLIMIIISPLCLSELKG